MRIGRTLRRLRESRGLSQKEVAEKAGIGTSRLSKYERDREMPKLDSLVRVLDVLGEVDLPGFFTIASLERRVTEMGPQGLLLPWVPGTGFPEMEQAFRDLFSHLVDLHQATLEALHRPRTVDRPPGDAPQLGLDSTRD